MLRALALAVVLASSPAGAEGLHFDGDELLNDHTMLKLTKAQRRAIRKAPEEELGDGTYKCVTLELTRRQRRALRRATGEDVHRIGACTRSRFELDCTCGDFNYAVIYPGGRIAVVNDSLDERF